MNYDDAFDLSSFGKTDVKPEPDSQVMPDDNDGLVNAAVAKRVHRRTKECTELSQRYEYRRAFSEVKMLEAMRYVKLENGVNYYNI